MDEREEIASGRDHVQRIAKYLLEGRAVAFVGSGFSKNAEPIVPGAKMQDWVELGRMFAREMGQPADALDSEAVPRLIEEFSNKYGVRARNDLIRKAIPNGSFEPGELHESLLQLPWKDIITTNIDTLLEETKRSGKPKLPAIWDPKQVGSFPSPRILKIHGDYSSDSSWVFSDSDYTKQDFSGWIWREAMQLISEYVIVFFGYSLSDPDFHQVYAKIQQEGIQLQMAYIFAMDRGGIAEPAGLLESMRILTPKDFPEDLALQTETMSEPEVQITESNIDPGVFLTFTLDTIAKALESQKTQSIWGDSDDRRRIRSSIQASNPEEWTILQTVLSECQLPGALTEGFEISPHRIEEANRILQERAERIKTTPDLADYQLEAEAILLEIDPKRSNSGASIPTLGILAARQSLTQSLDVQVTVQIWELIASALLRRLRNALHIGLDNSLILQGTRLLNKLSRSSITKKQESIELRSINRKLKASKLISGEGIAESKLYRGLKFLFNVSQHNSELWTLLRFRYGIASIYENDWKSVQKLLVTAQSLAGWKEPWTALLHAEMGDFKSAAEAYLRIIHDASETQATRYLAAKAWEGRRNVGSHIAQEQDTHEEATKRVATLKAQVERNLSKNATKDEYQAIATTASEATIAGLQKQTIDGLQAYIDDQDYESLRFRTGDPFGRLNRLIFAHYITGTPLGPLRTRQMRQMIRAIIEPPLGLNTLLEFNGVLPVFEEFEKEKILERASFVALREPNLWHKLQRRIITQVLNLLQIIGERETEKSGPLERRLMSLLSLLSKISPLLSRASLGRLQSEVKTTLPALRQHPFMNAHGLIPALANVLAAIARNMKNSEATAWIVALEPWQYHDRFGNILLSEITDLLDMDFWGNLTESKRSQFLSAMQTTDRWSMQGLLEFYESQRKHGNPEELQTTLVSLAEKIKNHRLKEIGEQIKSSEKQNLPEHIIQQLKEEEQDWINETQPEYVEWQRALSSEGHRGEKKTQPISVTAWIAAKHSRLAKSFPSPLLRDINQLDLRNLSAGDRSALEEFLESILQRLESLREKGRLDYTFKSQVLGPMQVFYLYVEEFDRWLSLWERFDHFEYDFRPLFPDDEKDDGGFICPSEFFNELAFRLPSLSRSNDRMRLLSALDFLSRYLPAIDASILPAIRVLMHNHEVLSHAAFLPLELAFGILENMQAAPENLEKLTLNMLKSLAGKRNLIAIPRTIVAYRALYKHLLSREIVTESEPLLRPFLDTLEKLDLPLGPAG